MEQKTLTKEQARVIAMAMLFVDAGEALESQLTVTSVEHRREDQVDMGFTVEFLAITAVENGEPIITQYAAYIGYYNKDRQTNPEYIDLSITNGFPQREAFGNIGYITDKLREYEIW